jgi:hypothetical protein
MVTNKALAELALWAEAASNGRGEEAKMHLVQFKHLGAAFLASPEFQERCRLLFGCAMDDPKLDDMCKMLDAIANIEVRQVERYGAASPRVKVEQMPAAVGHSAPAR